VKFLDSEIVWKYPLTQLDLSSIRYIVVHHVAAVNASPLEVDQWDKGNGWNGAGYNYYVRKDGSKYIMRGDNLGAQCQGYNSVSIGVGCEGNYQYDCEKPYDTEMPIEQLKSLIDVVVWLKARFPDAEIKGHGELFNTLCPGEYFPLSYVKCLSLPTEKVPLAVQSINTLFDHKIITDTSYWTANVWEGGKVNGGYMQTIIKRFVACYKLVNTFEDVLQELVSMNIIGDSGYWLENAIEGGITEGKWVEIVINRMAEYVNM